MSWINDFSFDGSVITDVKTKLIKVLSDINAYDYIDVNTASIYYDIIGDVINLGANSSEFNDNLKLVINRNDIRLLNGSDVFYINSNTCNFKFKLIKGETIIIQKFE